MLKHKIFSSRNDILDYVNLNKIKRIDIINIQKHETGYELFYFDKRGKYETRDYKENLFMYVMFVLLLIQLLFLLDLMS